MTESTRGTGAGQPRGEWPFTRPDDAVGSPPAVAVEPPARAQAPDPTAVHAAPDAAGAGPSGSGPSSAEPSSAEPGPKAPGSRRRTVLIAVGVGVVVVGGVVAAVSGVFGGSDPVAVPSPSTVTLPSPTPTIQPAARQPVSTFADALPSSVLAYALTAVSEQPPLLAAGALEGYKLDYSDGGSGSVTLYAGQWETAPEAAAAYNAAVAAATAAAPAAAAATPSPQDTPKAPESGTVEVAGQPVGTWTVTTAADGTGTATWTNGTAMFQTVGPADVVADFYSAFPL